MSTLSMYRQAIRAVRATSPSAMHLLQEEMRSNVAVTNPRKLNLLRNSLAAWVDYCDVVAQKNDLRAKYAMHDPESNEWRSHVAGLVGLRMPKSYDPIQEANATDKLS